MPNWDRVNIWTNTLYSLIQALTISKQIHFGNLPRVHESIVDSGQWIIPEASYNSVLAAHKFGTKRATFRRDPNKHFDQISRQLVKMLIQDLVVILDEMMSEILATHNLQPNNFPQSKVQQLSSRLDPKYNWAMDGCLELIAVRNVLAHANGIWNARSIAIVHPFVIPPPQVGESLSVGIPMLFRFRKAMRTFLNEVG